MTVYFFPGQASQKIGMGALLFPEFPEIVHIADDILGYSISELCLKDPDQKLNQTQFTQPALYVVNALSYLKKVKECETKSDYFAGHSLGEYNALFAAGVFDFVTGLKLVQERGRLMGKITGGGMAAVLGLTTDEVLAILKQNQLNTLSIANYNSYTQHVISGPKKDIVEATTLFTNTQARYIPLNVSGAFHSIYMQEIQTEFSEFLRQFTYFPSETSIIANINAEPYQFNQVAETLSKQINYPVLWKQTIEYLLNQGETHFEEMGPGQVLTNLVSQIQKEK